MSANLPKAFLYSSAAALVVTTIVIVSTCCRPTPHVSVRVGWDHSPPYFIGESNNGAQGMVVEVMEAAARRANITLEWVRDSSGIDLALGSKRVDIWPLASRTPDRDKAIFLTEPWLENQMVLVSLQNQPVASPANLTNEAVVHLNTPPVKIFTSTRLPRAHAMGLKTRAELFEAVCTETARAAVIDLRYLDRYLLDRPPACSQKALTLATMPGGTMPMGIAARHGQEAAARALYNEISVMAADGSLQAQLEHWSPFSASEPGTLMVLQRERARTFWLVAGSATMAVALLALFWQTRVARRAVKRLSESEKRFSRLFEHLPAAAVAVENGTLLQNSAAVHLTGFSREELSTETGWFSTLYGPEAGNMQRQYLSASPHQSRYVPVKRKDGNLRTAELLAYQDGDRRIWLLYDVTDRESAQERFRVLFEHSSDAHLIFDEKGVLDCNQAALRLLRCHSKEDVLGVHPATLSPPLQPDGRRSDEKRWEIDAKVRTSGYHRFDWLHQRFDGSRFLCEVSLTSVPLAGTTKRLAVWHDLTPRQQAEEELKTAHDLLALNVEERTRELRESEERFRCLVTATSQIIWTSDSEGRMRGRQSAWSEFTGQNLEDHQDYGWLKAIHSADLPVTFAALQRGIAHREPFSVDQRVRRHDGTWRYCRMQAVPVLEDHGCIREWINIQTDFTERRLMDEKIRASEESFRLLAETMPQIVWTTGPCGAVQYMNERWVQYTGLKRESNQKQNWQSAVHPDDRLACSQRWQSALASGTKFEFEFRIRRALDGEWCWHLGRALAQRDSNSEIIGWIGTITDIDSFKRAAAENELLTETLQKTVSDLRRSEELFRILTESVPQLIWISDGDANVRYCNQRSHEYLGSTESELASGMAWNAIHPDDLGRYKAARLLAVQTSSPYSVEYRLRRSDGTYRWHITRSIPYVSDEGEVTAWVGAAADVEDYKTAVAQIQQLNETLETRVEERTRDLAKANAELEVFSYTVSHDLRSPLGAVIGFCSLLQEEHRNSLSDEAQEYLGLILQSAGRMSQLITDLLELGKISRAELNRDTLDLSALACSVASALKARDPNSRTEITIEDGLRAVGDRRLLLAALENLIGNAWKYSGKTAQPKVEIGGRRSGEHTVFYVRDNGAGFDMKYADKLFKPFQRLHKETEFSGTGVGLSTVHRIIEKHGGRIWAEAEVGKGATFLFTLERNGA